MSEEKLAIIKEVGYGCRDAGYPILWFSAYTSECSAALQVMSGPDADKLIRDYGVYDVHDLNGKPCWVTESNCMIKYARAFKK